MIKVYIIRHGETIFNKKRITQGWKDSPLTKKGIESARSHGNFLKSKSIEIIYSSDLGRCIETSKIISSIIKKKIILSNKIRERNFGIFNGKSDKLIKNKNFFIYPGIKAPKGESFKQSKNRIIYFLNSIKSQKFKIILLVTHEGPMRSIISYYKNIEPESKKCNTNSSTTLKLNLDTYILRIIK